MEKEQYQEQREYQSLRKRRDRSLKQQIMQQMAYLNYPVFSHYCFGCNELIGAERARGCKHCSKTAHLPCVLKFNLFYNENPLESICKHCHSVQFCWNCGKSIFQFEPKIKCSVCLMFMHIECWKLPLELFSVSNQYFDRIYHKFGNSKRTVCAECQKRWQLMEISFTTIIDGQSFYLVSINHRSPLHYVWKTSKDVVDLLSKRGEEDLVLLESKYTIQNIFAMELPSKFMHFTLNDLVHFLGQERIYKCNEQVGIQFLVKWKNKQTLMWQDFDLFQYRDQLIYNFLRQFQLSFVRCNPRNQMDRSISNIIDFQLINYDIFKKVSYIKLAKDSKAINTSDNDQIMGTINQMFVSGRKFSIKTNSRCEQQKIEALTTLINTIFFVHKNIAPILLFTERAKTKWWSSRFNELNPYHVVFILGGTQKYITTIIKKHLFCVKKSQMILRHNIIIFEYESLSFVEKNFSLPMLIYNSALMIMDERMNPIARQYYNTAKISKIKLSNKHEEESSNMSLKNTSSSSSLPSVEEIVQNQEIQKLNTSLSKKAEEELQHDYGKSNQALLQIWSKIKSNFVVNQYFEQQMLNELQRLVVLRYIMAFGLLFQEESNYYQGIMRFEKFAFNQENQVSQQAKIKRYMNDLLSVMWAGEVKKEIISKEILEYYFFDVQLKEIFSRSILINRIKRFYDKNIAKNNCQINFERFLCEAILQRGFGQWQAIGSYSKVWQVGRQKMTFYQFFKLKVQGEVKVQTFYKCLRKNFMTVLQKIKKTKLSMQ